MRLDTRNIQTHFESISQRLSTSFYLDSHLNTWRTDSRIFFQIQNLELHYYHRLNFTTKLFSADTSRGLLSILFFPIFLLSSPSIPSYLIPFSRSLRTTSIFLNLSKHIDIHRFKNNINSHSIYRYLSTISIQKTYYTTSLSYITRPTIHLHSPISNHLPLFTSLYLLFYP